MNKRKLIWAVISFGIAILSIVLVIRQSKTFQPELLLESMKQMNRLWLICAFASMFGFIFFEGWAVVRITRALGYPRSVRNGVLYGASDVYFSAITPSASGGQPASAYFMVKDGISGSVVTITLLLNLIMYSAALFTIGTLATLCFGRLLLPLSLEFRLLFGIGACVLVGLTVLFYLLLMKERLLYRICDRLLRILEHLHLVRHGEQLRRRLLHSMERYRECAQIITADRRLLLDAYLLNVLQRLSQLGVSFFVFLACKKGALLSVHAMITQCFVAIGSNSVPIPGGMGVADYMMLNGFTQLLGSAEAVQMELLCRGITFYGCVITGGVITAIGYFLRRRST